MLKYARARATADVQVGPAGVGKSQMCFQLSLLCAAPPSVGGLGAATIYIDTERKFSPVRWETDSVRVASRPCNDGMHAACFGAAACATLVQLRGVCRSGLFLLLLLRLQPGLHVCWRLNMSVGVECPGPGACGCRFAEMARSRFPTHFGHDAADSAEMLKATMSRVLLLSPPNSSQLLKCLE
eukprot:356880-Chlamydomonas_euryale.AAC.1